MSRNHSKSEKQRLRAEELMNAALRLFADRGFATVTIQNIAKSVPVNSALIYYYFENKEALFKASLHHAATVAIDNFMELSEPHDTPVELIGDWFDNHIKSFEVIRYMLKVMIDYSVTHEQAKLIKDSVAKFYGFEQEILTENIAQGIQMGLFRSIDPSRAAELASTLLDGAITRSQIQNDMNFAETILDLKLIFWRYLEYDA